MPPGCTEDSSRKNIVDVGTQALMTSALGEARETLEVVEERMRRSSVVVALFPR